MKTISLAPITKWMHRNARALELTQWQYYFENGSKEAVVDALMFYQNEDGGFGHAVEPDNWNSHSTPYATLYAINILKQIDFEEMAHPIYKGIQKYVAATCTEGWHFVIPSNNECPCASYFRYEASYDEVERTGVTLEYCAFVITHFAGTAMHQKVLAVIPELIGKLEHDQLGDMGPSAYIVLIEAMKKAEVPGYDYEKLEEKLSAVVNGAIQRDPKQWQSYGYRPSDMIKSKESAFYKGNEEIVEKELDFLCESLPENDVWANPWSWFENNEKYPAAYQLSTNWYKAVKAIERVRFLKYFNRLMD